MSTTDDVLKRVLEEEGVEGLLRERIFIVSYDLSGATAKEYKLVNDIIEGISECKVLGRQHSARIIRTNWHAKQVEDAVISAARGCAMSVWVIELGREQAGFQDSF